MGGDGKGFLARPPLAEYTDRIGAQRPKFGGTYRGDQRGGHFLAPVGLLEPGDRGGGRAAQIAAEYQVADHQRECSGGQVAAGMAVSESRGLAAERERVAAREPGRRDAHHPAAALAVIDRLADCAGMPGVQSAEARHAGSPPVMEELLAAQPAAGWLSILSAQPALVCAPDRRSRVATAFRPQLVAEQPFCGKQGHLSVVGDRPGPAVCGYVPPDPGRPVVMTDLSQGFELDSGAECVTYRAAEQAAAVPVTRRRHLAAPIRLASAGLSG